MAQIGDKFVIEIAEVFPGAESGKPKYRIKGFDNLVFDDNGLKRLTNFSDLYNLAYQDGYMEGYRMADQPNVDGRFIQGFQTAAVKYTSIINDLIDAFDKIDKEDN